MYLALKIHRLVFTQDNDLEYKTSGLTGREDDVNALLTNR